MSEARQQILSSVRRSLKRGELGAAEKARLEERLAAPARNLIPERAVSRDHAGQVDLFVEQAEEVQTTVTRVASLGDVPQAVAAYLAAQNLPTDFALAPDPALDEIPWAMRPMLRPRRGKPEPGDMVGVSTCFAGIAETGTLMMVSGPETPSTMNFLPDTEIVVVRDGQIVAGYEDAWDRLRARQKERGEEGLPRTVNFVTGPSRTGDIEQRLVLGAHGPRRLHLVLVDPASAGQPG